MDREMKTAGVGNMELCPMASMCKGMAEKPGVALLLIIPGFLLVVGVLIVIEPRILVWLLAGSLIAIGLRRFPLR